MQVQAVRCPMGVVGGSVMAAMMPTLMDFPATTPNTSLQPTLASVGRLSSTVGQHTFCRREMQHKQRERTQQAKDTKRTMHQGVINDNR